MIEKKIGSFSGLSFPLSLTREVLGEGGGGRWGQRGRDGTNLSRDVLLFLNVKL